MLCKIYERAFLKEDHTVCARARWTVCLELMLDLRGGGRCTQTLIHGYVSMTAP